MELHIEQGSVLEQRQAMIGIVEGIAGIRRYAASFRGRADHAGTTPMESREDALVLASPFVLDVRDIAIATDVVATVGTVAVHPGAPNVIPGRVEMSVEARDIEESKLDRFERRLLRQADKRGASVALVSSKAPVASSPRLVASLHMTCTNLRVTHLRMQSGAGHDAGCMAALTDQAMIFVPSRGGISHSPDEYTDAESCIMGANVLSASLLRLDSELDSADAQLSNTDTATRQREAPDSS